MKLCDSSAGIIRIRFAGRGLLALLSAQQYRAPRAWLMISEDCILWKVSCQAQTGSAHAAFPLFAELELARAGTGVQGQKINQ